jgi:putative ABC transport system permease protein
VYGLLHDLRQAFRSLRKRPGFSAVGIATLALGIGANTTIFTFVNTLLLRPLPFPQPDRLVRIQSVRGQESGKLMVREWEELERESNLFRDVAGYYPSQYNMAEGGPPIAARAVMTTSSLFRVLGANFALGSPWPDGSHRTRSPLTVLTYAVWKQRYGGDPGIVGKSILLDASPYQVVGVAGPEFQYPSRPEIYRAAFLYHDQNRMTRCLFALGRLKAGVSISEAQSRLDAFAGRMEQEFPDTNRGIRFRVSPLQDQFVGEVRAYLILTWLLVGAVLLIACANLGNLLLSRALSRRREIAIRSALGAGLGRIVQQMLAEALVLSAFGALSALLLSSWWTRVFRSWIHTELPPWMSFEPSPAILGFTAGMALLTAVLTAATPAILIAGSSLMEAFQESSRGSSSGRRQQWARDLLMGGELALCVVLLVAAGLLLRSFSHLLDTDIGFRRESMLTVHVDPPFSKYNKAEQTSLFYRQAQQRLSELPGVETVAANHSLPFAGNDNYGKPAVVLDGQSDQEHLRNPFVNVQVVSPNYLNAIGIPLRSGRHFDDGDRVNSTPVAILSRPLARRLYGGADPTGRRFRFIGLLGSTEKKQDAWFTVIGVAEGARTEGLLAGQGMDVYLSNQQQFVGDTYFLLRTRQNPASLAPQLSRIFEKIDPEQAIFDIATMDTRIENTVWQRRLAGGVSFWFGLLALLLAAIGAYGVISYSVTQRTREVGIRMALGSTPAEIARLVVRQGLTVAMAGIGAGVFAAAILAVLVRPLLHGIHSLDPLTFVAVTGILTIVCLLACYLPARRAAAIDPMAALRQE